MSRAVRLAKAARRRRPVWAWTWNVDTGQRDWINVADWVRDNNFVTHFVPGVRLDLAAYHRRRKARTRRNR